MWQQPVGEASCRDFPAPGTNDKCCKTLWERHPASITLHQESREEIAAAWRSTPLPQLIFLSYRVFTSPSGWAAMHTGTKAVKPDEVIPLEECSLAVWFVIPHTHWFLCSSLAARPFRPWFQMLLQRSSALSLCTSQQSSPG